MTKPTRTSLGNIPKKGVDKELREFLGRIKQHIEVANQGGNSGMHRFVSIQDLVDLDLAQIVARHGSTAVNALLNGRVYVEPAPGIARDLSTPQALTDLAAVSTFRAIILTWDGTLFPTYGYTEIWRAQVDDLGQAVLAGTSVGRIYLDSGVDSGINYYYWVRAISVYYPDAPPGPFNAVAGTAAGVGLIGGEDLTDLIITAGKIADGSIDLSGDKITGLLSDLNMDVIGDPTKIADGLISNTKLAALAVTAAKIADGSIDLSGTKIAGLLGNLNLAVISDPTKIADSLIGNTKLASAAVTSAKIADGSIDLSGNKITGILDQLNLGVISDPTKILDGLIDTNKLANLAVDAAKLADSSVTATKIGNLAVGTAAIQTAAITTALIANAAVGSAQIADAAITNAKIADAAIDTAAINTAAITQALIANAAVGSAQIIDAAITSAKIDSAAVGTAAIQDAAITTALIANLAVGSAQVKDAAITEAKIANLAVDTAAIKLGAITTALIANAAVGSAQIVNAAITEAKIANLAVGNSAIQNAAITNAKIAALAVDDAHIANLNAVKINAGILDTNRLNIDGSTLISVAGVLQLGDVNANSITGGTLDFQNVTAENLTVANLEGDVNVLIPFSLASAVTLGAQSTTIWSGQIPAAEVAGIGRKPFAMVTGWGVFEVDVTYQVGLYMRVNETVPDISYGTVLAVYHDTFSNPPYFYYEAWRFVVAGDQTHIPRAGQSLEVGGVAKGIVNFAQYNSSTNQTTVWYVPNNPADLIVVGNTVIGIGGAPTMDLVSETFFRTYWDYHAYTFSVSGGLTSYVEASTDVEVRVTIYYSSYKAVPTSINPTNWNGDKVFGLDGVLMGVR